ncbi:hypothetical protein K435DRAFT_805602 [Dendrothele bispora CBS 962.96]|uniref:UbiA prenyltransferase n=1 Tax=Dendrothele bispora (strain CBS 962.96) TaxID=1314807 RepID=A0A4S8LAG6_DENBC|nr:hypothetical protein K435DRAFT_805602 [Dendrothele bispora CBS 962.96]
MTSDVLCFVWIWLYLLQFCTANQVFSGDEDAMNKPYRPIPAGLISVRNTWILRWTLVPICFALSWCLDVTLAGLSLTVSFILYNELGLHAYFYSKNILNAIGIVSWNVGAAQILHKNNLNPHMRIATFLNIMLIFTTIHVQDFRDEAGDRKLGRITFPVVFPVWSRRITSALLLAWTVELTTMWRLNYLLAISFVVLGSYTAGRILTDKSEAASKVSLRLYMASRNNGDIIA